jgi:hypothetical protein
MTHPRHRLDAIIHSPTRFSIMAMLMAADKVEFRFILWGSKSRPTPLDLVICVFSSQGMIVRCGVASALPDLPPPIESVNVAGSLVGV